MGGELAAGSWHHAPPPPGEARPGQPAPAPAQRAVTRARADRRVGQRDVKSLFYSKTLGAVREVRVLRACVLVQARVELVLYFIYFKE